MNRTQVTALVGAVVVVAGCSTTTRGDGFGPASTTVDGLAAQITHGAVQIKTVQATLHVSSTALDQTSTFREQLTAGNVTAMDNKISTTARGTTNDLRLIYVDKTLYVDHAQNGKPWVIATPSSSDPVVSQLAETLPATLSSSSVRYYAVLASASKDLRLIGREAVDGVPCVHYALSIDPRVVVQKLPENQRQAMQQAIDAGVGTIPVDEWVDAQGRPVKVTDTVTAQGQTVKIDLRMSHFDEPITIDAPPANQIAPS
jgi:hypothetical protein